MPEPLKYDSFAEQDAFEPRMTAFRRIFFRADLAGHMRDQHNRRVKEYLYISEDVSAFVVFEFEGDLLRNDDPFPKNELTYPEKPRREVQDVELSFGICLDDGGSFGARADEGHLSPYDIEELWNLVDAGGADEAADRREARVIDLRMHRQISVRALLHRPELEELENAPPLADPLLPENQRPGGIYQNDDARDQKKRQGDDEKNRCCNNLSCSFQQSFHRLRLSLQNQTATADSPFPLSL